MELAKKINPNSGTVSLTDEFLFGGKVNLVTQELDYNSSEVFGRDVNVVLEGEIIEMGPKGVLFKNLVHNEICFYPNHFIRRILRRDDGDTWFSKIGSDEVACLSS